jgi:hypothetical protein
MATKESKRQARELIEALELRAHRGPPVQLAEIQSLKTYLRQNDFSLASDYFNRLTNLESRLQSRASEPLLPAAKRNYGGEAAGYQMQVQSVYDHLILSTCYQGDFNGKRGRIKLSHRFNREGRIDFVELKYLRSLHPALHGELRKLLLVNNYQALRKDWLEAEASVLRILPQELIFLYEDVFRCDRMELFAWLANIGHGLLADLLKELTPSRQASRAGQVSYALAEAGRSSAAPAFMNSQSTGVLTAEAWPPARGSANGTPGPVEAPAGLPNTTQLPLPCLAQDHVALPILEKAAVLEATAEPLGPTEILLRYARRTPAL